MRGHNIWFHGEIRKISLNYPQYSLIRSSGLTFRIFLKVQAGTQSTTTSTANSLGIPQMLFLNQITVNGQTSFVLVDSNNKPVQLPQGERKWYYKFAFKCIYECSGRFD